MTILEKLASLKVYMVGGTGFKEPDKKFMACSFYTSLEEYSSAIYWEEVGIELPPLIYGATIEDVIEEAYEWETSHPLTLNRYT